MWIQLAYVVQVPRKCLCCNSMANKTTLIAHSTCPVKVTSFFFDGAVYQITMYQLFHSWHACSLYVTVSLFSFFSLSYCHLLWLLNVCINVTLKILLTNWIKRFIINNIVCTCIEPYCPSFGLPIGQTLCSGMKAAGPANYLWKRSSLVWLVPFSRGAGSEWSLLTSGEGEWMDMGVLASK